MSDTAAPVASPANFNAALAAHRATLAPEPAANTNGAPPKPKQAATQLPANDNASDHVVADVDGDADVDGLELDAQTLTDDASQLEQDTSDDPLAEMLHGRTAREILDAIKKGELPAELLGALKGIAKVNGEDVPVTFQEALAGYMRTSDYTRQKKELATTKREATERFEAVKSLIQSWDNGDALLTGLRKLGKADAFKQAAIAFAKEEYQNEVLRQQNPQAFELRQQVQREREAREALEARLAQQPDAGRVRAHQELAQQLNTLVPQAFERLAIKDTPSARDLFSRNLQALYEDGVDVADVVNQAAQATHEELADLARKYAEHSTTQPKPKVPGGATRTQAAPQVTKPQPPTSRRPEDFQAFIRQRRGY